MGPVCQQREQGKGLAWTHHCGSRGVAIETIVTRNNIDCGFRRVPGVLHAAIYGEKDETDELRDECELARRLGFRWKR